VQHLGVTGNVHSPHVGDLTILAQPVRLSRTPSTIERYPPACGEHTDEVLGEFGFPPDEIAALHRDQII
jgi:formyl-CoA transferase